MKIEFEITLRCNAECSSCSRHCHYGMYGYDSDVKMEQVERFIAEVSGHRSGVDIVHIMGGEPTVHPLFELIVHTLKVELLAKNVIKRLQVVSNGIIPVNPNFGVPVSIARPADKSDKHRCQFVAPLDTGQLLNKECRIPTDCGISFGAYGYWPCGAGGAIARLFGLNLFNRMTIPDSADDFPDTTQMCVLCQVRAQHVMMTRDYGDIRSRSFREAMCEFDAKKFRRY